MGDVSQATNRLKSVAGPDSTLPVEFSLTDLVVTFLKAAADGMAADTTAATKFWTNPFDFAVKVISGKASGNAALVAHDSNKARISIQTDDGADSAPAVCLEWDTRLTGVGTGTWATDVAKDNAGANNNQAVARVVPGANLFFAIAKDGTGVVVPISLYTVRLRRID